MRFLFGRFSYLLIVFSCLIALTGVLTAAMSKRSFGSRYSGLTQGTGAAGLNVTSSLQDGQNMEVIVVSLTPEGFIPKEAVFPKKRFVLAINNRVGLSDISLDLFGERMGMLQRKNLRRETMSLQWEMELQPGNYELRGADHPDWVLTLADVKR